MLNRLYNNMAIMLKQVSKLFSRHALRFNQRAFYFVFLYWVKHLFRANVMHVKVHHRKLDRPVVIVSNHASGWDPFLILSAIPRRLFFNQLTWRFPAYHGFFTKIRFIHYRIFFWTLGVFPIRSDGDLKKSLRNTIDFVRNGNSMIFFPEGKRVRAHEKVRPKKGIGYLIKQVDVYVLPVHISYEHRGSNGKGSRFGKSRVVVGDLIKSEHFIETYGDDVRHIAIMKHVQDLSEMSFRKSAISFNIEKIDAIQ